MHKEWELSLSFTHARTRVYSVQEWLVGRDAIAYLPPACNPPLGLTSVSDPCGELNACAH